MTQSIDDLVYGHAKAKKTLQVLIKRSKERYYKKCVKGETVNSDPLKCLIIGPSGTGKTHLIHTLSKIHSVPLLTLDATQFIPSGCSNTDGINSTQLVKMINRTASEYVRKPEFHSVEGVLNQMVIFVDEFDKLGTSFDSSGNWNKHVQANFLTLIDNKDEFAGISWVFAGAFSSLYENRVSKSIGFFQSGEKPNESEISDEDILKAGVIPEMLGRISLIVELDKFTEKDYEKILVEKLLPNYPDLYHVDTAAIAEKAFKSGQGIRSLTRQLEMLSIEMDATFEESLLFPFSPKNG